MKGRGFGRTNGRGDGRENARHEEPDRWDPDRDRRPGDTQGAPMNDLTGNGIVNNGPENELSGLRKALGGDNGAESGTGKGDDDGSGREDFGFGDDELALRRLFHTAVEDLEPSDGALDHLRKAVPTRRARKRQAMVGVAAAALLCGTAIPAFVHVANSSSTTDSRSVNAGHGEREQHGADGGKTSGGIHKDTDHLPGEASSDPDASGKPDKPKDPSPGSVNGGTGGTAPPHDTSTASSPVCDPNQLNVVTARTGAPTADGTVYGTFRVANVSGSECAVAGKGTVNFTAAGAADRDKIAVVQHTAGDQASGLPDPSLEAPAMVLPPNGAYEVQFAWVPADTCPTVDPSPDPSPTDNVSSGTTTGSTGGSNPGSSATSGTDATSTDTQLVEDGGGTEDGSVTVSHTAEPGSPVAEATIPNACAGTIYRTGVLPPTA
ncbi:hypothetical protein [Streptomyces liangshanensis]|uniref:DUF4232 domain-containing protein n=1 Tax=Streptomyces liangshanensis TaxID=2717324 RepID=A0A6G9GZ64_9ACTN|nr:hypothetical protein [Streptomyces liangshanensis]QIQ03525.1 hypothetical protein HA039_15355 [Streptomyces liangshanensis]